MYVYSESIHKIIFACLFAYSTISGQWAVASVDEAYINIDYNVNGPISSLKKHSPS